jgi:hypothetical protein
MSRHVSNKTADVATLPSTAANSAIGPRIARRGSGTARNTRPIPVIATTAKTPERPIQRSLSRWTNLTGKDITFQHTPLTHSCQELRRILLVVTSAWVQARLFKPPATPN